VQQTNNRSEDGVLYDVLGNGATTHVAGCHPQQRALELVVSAITPLTCENGLLYSAARPTEPPLGQRISTGSRQTHPDRVIVLPSPSAVVDG
jgi:hypothetical protein